MPVVPADWLHDAFSRLGPGDLERLRRFKIVPISWMPTKTIAAVVDLIGLREARRLGMPVVGRVLPSDFRAAMRRHFAASLLNKTTHHLRRTMPDASASSRVTAAQALWFCIALLAAAACSALAGADITLLVFGLISGLFFCAVIVLRMLCLMPQVQKAAAVAPMEIQAEDLPVYTVLVPLFRETRVLRKLIGAMSALNYPAHLLDIKLILEESDVEMQRAVNALVLPAQFDIIVVPAGFPQTKPRALNYAMAFARGSLVTIYDSEDVPESNQLLLAAHQFLKADDGVACLQARLRFFNPVENWLARQFAAEYAVLFDVVLPALADQHLPLLLGGTSNHFRVDHLKQIGGWDPFNVTEDADLGLRLARMGYRTETLDSMTYEEANIKVSNWLKQRRRWLKGFLQTWLVHTRAPAQAMRELGFAGFCTSQCMTLGVFASALLHPILIAVGVWCLLPAQMAGTADSLLGSMLAGLDLFLLLAGYVTTGISMKRAMTVARLPAWGWLVLSLPAYWILLSIAAWLAVFDFCVAPFHWHKTEHGLSWMSQPGQERLRTLPQRPRRRSTCNPAPG